MTRLLYIVVFLSVGPAVLAQAPGWVEGASAEFPSAEYLTGLGIATVHKDSAQETTAAHAYSAAKRDLIEKVRVRVQASTESIRQQTDQNYSALYASTVASSSELEIVGLHRRDYVDHQKRRHYVWVYARKPEVIRHHRAQQRQQAQQLQALFAEAQECRAAGRRGKAEQLLLRCRPMVAKLTNSASVLRSLGADAPAADPVTARQLEQALEGLVREEVTSLPDLAYVLVNQLRQSQEAVLSKVMVLPPVYRQSPMASQFSRQFKAMLEHEMVNHARWSTVARPDVRFANGAPGARYRVRGEYEALGDRLVINLYLEDIFTQEIIGMATATLPQQVVADAELSYIPPQFEARQGEQELFETESMLSHGIDLDVWTNKGRDALTYTEGETMDIFYRVNIPCYVRFVYHLADGQRVHFFDRQVSAAEVGQALRVPYDFVCDCTDAPCGVETLQMNARETPLPDLATKKINGYEFITEDLANVIRKNRINSEDDRSHYQAEKRLVITTMP